MQEGECVGFWLKGLLVTSVGLYPHVGVDGPLFSCHRKNLFATRLPCAIPARESSGGVAACCAPACSCSLSFCG